jgi:hypothetical protein
MSKNFTQILIRTRDNEEIPETLKFTIDSVKREYPECQYTLYNNEMLKEFIFQHFDKDVLECYENLKPYAYKCDLARYCVTYIMGGWYADVTTNIVCHINNYLDYDFICFYDAAYDAGSFDPSLRWDYSNSFKFGIQNAFFYTKSKNIVLEKSIDLIVENYKNKYYGKYPHMPTGPGCLSISYLLNVHKLDKVHEGMHVALTPQHIKPNFSYLLSDGTIIAYYKNLSNEQYGFDQKYNYKTLWNEKRIYGEK